MNTENDYNKFKTQFTDSQWAKLDSNLEFKSALAADDFDMAMELAGRILIGESKSMSKARKMKKAYDDRVTVMEALKVHDCITRYTFTADGIMPEWKAGGVERALNELARTKPFGLKKVHRAILFQVLPEKEREKICSAFLEKCRLASLPADRK